MKAVNVKPGENVFLVDERSGKSYPVQLVPKGLRLGRPATQIKSSPPIRKTC